MPMSSFTVPAIKVVRRLRFGAPLGEAQIARLAEIAEKTLVTLALKQGMPTYRDRPVPA